jgi:hypothetical protein
MKETSISFVSFGFGSGWIERAPGDVRGSGSPAALGCTKDRKGSHLDGRRLGRFTKDKEVIHGI